MGRSRKNLLTTARAISSSGIPNAMIGAEKEYLEAGMDDFLVKPLQPEALRERSEPVLISSRVFQQEIADQIRTGLGCPNELILLYNV